MRIPLWYHPRSDYYVISMDAMLNSPRIGFLQIRRTGIRYVMVPVGEIRMGELVDDPSKEVILNGGE